LAPDLPFQTFIRLVRHYKNRSLQSPLSVDIAAGFRRSWLSINTYYDVCPVYLSRHPFDALQALQIDRYRMAKHGKQRGRN